MQFQIRNSFKNLKFILIILFICSNYLTTDAQESPCNNVSFSIKTKVNIENAKRAVFKINAGQIFGTGFLIDKTNGIMITASHVLSDYYTNPNTVIKAWNPDVIDEKVIFEKIADLRDSNIDLSILKVKDLEKWNSLKRKVKDLDIRFGATSMIANKQSDDSFHVVSHFTNGKSTYNYRAHSKEFKSNDIQKVEKHKLRHFETEDDVIPIGHEFAESQSGSPLLDKNGLVVGVLIQVQKRQNITLALPSDNLLELIKRIPQENINSLSNRLKSKKVKKSTLIDDFDTDNTDEYISNYELAQFVINIIDSEDMLEYVKFKDFLHCPILAVLNSRGFSNLATELLNNYLHQLSLIDVKKINEDEYISLAQVGNEFASYLNTKINDVSLNYNLTNSQLNLILNRNLYQFEDTTTVKLPYQYAIVNLYETRKKILFWSNDNDYDWSNDIDISTSSGYSDIPIVNDQNYYLASEIQKKALLGINRNIDKQKHFSELGDVWNILGYPALAAKAYQISNEEDKLRLMFDNSWITEYDVSNPLILNSKAKKELSSFEESSQLKNYIQSVRKILKL